jgi:structural maintenance of chromosome 4
MEEPKVEDSKAEDSTSGSAIEGDASAEVDVKEAHAKAEEDDMVHEQKEDGFLLARYVPQSVEELKALDKDDIKYEMTMLEEQLAHQKPNMRVIEEYRRKLRQYLARVEQLEQTTKRRDQARQGHDRLRKQRLDEFMAGFSVITMRLKEMYQMLTLGGDAELELVDSLDPFSEGIVFSVRPPKKSWKHIQNLSGGEKTLSSLALVFALHHFKPTPLYVMDEIDAALDFKNVSIVANYIKERTRDAQFIIISLRNNMFELADRLVGIYKTHDMTNTITIDPAQFSTPLQTVSTTEALEAPL